MTGHPVVYTSHPEGSLVVASAQHPPPRAARIGVPLCALFLSALAAVVCGWVLSIDPVMPAPLPTQEARVVVITDVPTAALTVTPTPTPTPAQIPTATPLPNCYIASLIGSICAWPTSTPVLPLPSCVTPDAGQACVERGKRVATVVGLWGSTPTPIWAPSMGGEVETR